MFDYAERRRRLGERMEADGVDVLFLAPSADLEYLTGVERDIPNFGEVAYAHGWVTGAFFQPGADPVFVLPRMFATFHLRHDPEGEVVVVNETDDGIAIFERVAGSVSRANSVAVGDRVWAEATLHLGHVFGPHRLRTGSYLVHGLRRVKTAEELEAMGRAIATVEQTMTAVAPLVVPGVTMSDLVEATEHELKAAGSRCPSFATHIFTGMRNDDFDSGTATGRSPIPEGTSVMFDFGGVVDGYCSDFGRTVYCGEPTGRLPRGLRDHARRARGGPRSRVGRNAGARGQLSPAASRSRTRVSASISATAWATASAWTSTSARSSRLKTRRRSSRG